MSLADGSSADAINSESSLKTAEHELEVHNNEDDRQFVERALEIKGQIETRSRGKLGVNAEVVTALESIPRTMSADLIRLSVRRARMHPHDNYVLMADVNWARGRLLAGASASPWILGLTTGGGLLAGIGAPMLISAMLAGPKDLIAPATIMWGSGLTVAGVAAMAVGTVMATRRN